MERYISADGYYKLVLNKAEWWAVRDAYAEYLAERHSGYEGETYWSTQVTIFFDSFDSMAKFRRMLYGTVNFLAVLI